MRYIEKGPIIDSSLSTGTTNAFEIAMTLIQERGLFGGAITGAVPESWLDGRFVSFVSQRKRIFPPHLKKNGNFDVLRLEAVLFARFPITKNCSSRPQHYQT